MGYKPLEFVNAYYDNIGRQNAKAIESNPIAQRMEKFVHSWYKEGHEVCWQSYIQSTRKTKLNSPDAPYRYP
jgi:hypothetical protein